MSSSEYERKDCVVSEECMPIVTYREDGTVKREEWWEGSVLHRVDGPAFVRYYDDGWFEVWYQHGQRHRDDGPAVTRFYEDGRVAREDWYLSGVRHRVDGPAVIEYYPDGTVKKEEWYFSGERGCARGASFVAYRPDGSVEHKVWHRAGIREMSRWYDEDGELHRDDGPANIYYREDGITRSGEEWFSHGRHRTDGPGHVAYNKKGEPVKETWFSPNGEPIDSPGFNDTILNL